MRLRFLVDWPALSAEQARDLSVERYPAGAVADAHSEAFGQSAVAAGAAEETTDPVTYAWKAPEPAPAPSDVQQAVADAEKAAAHALDVLKATAKPAA